MWNYFTGRECQSCQAETPPEKTMKISRHLLLSMGLILVLSIASSLTYGMYYFVIIFEKTFTK
jgi:nitrate reductase NapE component